MTSWIYDAILNKSWDTISYYSSYNYPNYIIDTFNRTNSQIINVNNIPYILIFRDEDLVNYKGSYPIIHVKFTESNWYNMSWEYQYKIVFGTLPFIYLLCPILVKYFNLKSNQLRIIDINNFVIDHYAFRLN